MGCKGSIVERGEAGPNARRGLPQHLRPYSERKLRTTRIVHVSYARLRDAPEHCSYFLSPSCHASWPASRSLW
jgi:hypothetical protein